MTLLVALRGRDGLVLAADSRGTFGDPRAVTAQNDSQRKAYILSKHVAVLAAGAGELATGLVRAVEQEVTALKIDGVTAVMEAVRGGARKSYGEWFPHLPPAVPEGMAAIARPDINLIVAGYDADASGRFSQDRIFQLASGFDFPPMLHEYGFALAGIVWYALYLLNRLYEPDRSLEELTALAVYAITETASQDGKVGGPVRLVTITENQGCLELDDEAVTKVLAENVRRSEGLKASFFGGSANG